MASKAAQNRALSFIIAPRFKTPVAELMFKTCSLLLFAVPGLALSADLFVDKTEEVGIDFVHFNGMTGKTYFSEMMGAGAAFLDYDGDGDLDIYLGQGHLLGPDVTMEDALIQPKDPSKLTDRLYRNELIPSGELQFTDVTEASGLRADGYAMGVSVDDLNNDGFPDLYLSNFGPNQLWMNNGDGTFKHVTKASGAGDDRWSVTALIADVNGDGWKDIYVVNYVDFSFQNIKSCRTFNDLPDYCSPQSFNPVTDRLLLNQQDGTFSDISVRAGVGQLAGPGLGGVAADFDGDSDQDIYVANDGAANFLWINNGQGKFSEEALMSGVAVNMAGTPEASMGVDAADFDNDGDLDLFMTHLDRQTNTLFVNDGEGWFMDQSGQSVLGSSSFPFTGFGTLWFDFDNDGLLDLMSANGAVVKEEEQVKEGSVLPLRQSNQLWRNTGESYEDVSAKAGSGITDARVSRGAAFGDVDNDGDVDVLITNNADRPNLLINNGASNSWIGLQVVGPDNGWLATGAKVRVTAGDKTYYRRVRTDGSYVSAHDPRIVLGLGSFAGDVSVQVTWPDGVEREFSLSPGEYHKIQYNKENTNK